MEDKENILSSLNSSSDNVGVTQAKYEVKIPFGFVSRFL